MRREPLDIKIPSGMSEYKRYIVCSPFLRMGGFPCAPTKSKHEANFAKRLSGSGWLGTLCDQVRQTGREQQHDGEQRRDAHDHRAHDPHARHGTQPERPGSDARGQVPWPCHFDILTFHSEVQRRYSTLPEFMLRVCETCIDGLVGAVGSAQPQEVLPAEILDVPSTSFFGLSFPRVCFHPIPDPDKILLVIKQQNFLGQTNRISSLAEMRSVSVCGKRLSCYVLSC